MTANLTTADFDWVTFALSLPFVFSFVGNDLQVTTKVDEINCKVLFHLNISGNWIEAQIAEVDAGGLPITFLVKGFVLNQIMEHVSKLPPLVTVHRNSNGVTVEIAGLAIESAVINANSLLVAAEFE